MNAVFVPCTDPKVLEGLRSDVARMVKRDNARMPQTSKEKQEAFRARNAMLGRTEVRGIFLPPDMHAELKAVAEKMRRRVSAKIPPHSETTGAK